MESGYVEGDKGSCLKYPPDVIPSNVKDGQILIDETAATRWKPRVVVPEGKK